MDYRIVQEKLEQDNLSIYACRSSSTKGRAIFEKECDVRTAYQRDRDRILHSKAFRRLAHKTQVFISPEGDHYRTRLTHTLEVAQIARTMARALRLNEDLTEAIALGHDLGHTPFGHSGEHVLMAVTGGAFTHNKQSLRIVEKLENKGEGLNLTYEVRDGILNHPTSGKPETLEGKIVQLSDKIAYINHDIDDALRGQIIKEADLPSQYMAILGNTSGKRINALIMDIILNSTNENNIKMSDSVQEAFLSLRKFLFQNVYVGSQAKEQEEKAKNIVKQLYEYYMEKYERLPELYMKQIDLGEDKSTAVCDYISGMTDRFAIHTYSDIFFPSSWQIY